MKLSIEVNNGEWTAYYEGVTKITIEGYKGKGNIRTTEIIEEG